MEEQERSCNTCRNRCMDMDLEPYCVAINEPFGQTLARGVPTECGPNYILWMKDTRALRKPEEEPPISKEMADACERVQVFELGVVKWVAPFIANAAVSPGEAIHALLRTAGLYTKVIDVQEETFLEWCRLAYRTK